MNRVRPFWPKYRLNPERPTVWFVGADDDDNIDKIELDLLAEGQPYMLPAWWTHRWGPFTKADANAVIDKFLDEARKRRSAERGFLPPIERSREVYETTPEPFDLPPDPPPAPPPPTITGSHAAIRRTLGELVGAGLQWRCAREMGANVHSWAGANALMNRVQGRHRMMGLRIRARVTCVKIGANTWLLDPNRALRQTETAGVFLIQYHRTIIVMYHRDGRVTLNTSGHSTPTTRQRLNDYVPHGWSISTLRLPAAMRGEDVVHTRSGFTGREWPRQYWVVFHGQSPYAPYRDGLTLPPVPD